MKIFKFKKVDAKTGISVDIERPREGPANPNLPGLEVVFDFGGFHYATVDNAAEANPENYIYEIDQAELDGIIKDKTLQYLNERKEEIYKQEKDLRQQLFGKYHDTASLAGVYKYEQALAVLADPTADAPEIEAEALARDVDVEVIAQRIVDNHLAFRVKEAQIAGLRGRITDRLDAFVFDDADAIGSWKELMERTEVIGQRELNGGPAGIPGNENLDVVVGYYDPNLSTRWQYLN
jgi:hypothetical protein